MSLQNELNFPNPFDNLPQEAVLSIVLTGNMLAKEGHRILRPLRLTDSQFNVLMLLKYQSEDGEMNQTTIGNMLLVNRSNVTGLIDRMEQAGWVHRRAVVGDRRVNQVQLTKTGRDLLEKAEAVYFTRIEEVMGKLSKKDQKLVCSLLERIRKGIQS